MTIRFAVIGINHNHIFGPVNALLGAGATFAGFFTPEDDLASDFAARYPQAVRLDSSARILDDPNIALVASAGVNADRAALGIEVMRAGKDFMSDKPGMTSLAQLEEVRRVQAETKRIYSIYYSERPCCTDRSLGGEDWTVYQGAVSDPGSHRCHSKQTKIAVITSRSSGSE